MKLLDPGLGFAATLPLADAQTLPTLLDASDAAIAVAVDPGVDVAALAPAFDRLALIAIPFAAFRDGRGFSTASMLREAGFKGELRAFGDLLADQARMLTRCGFDSVELPSGALRAEWERMLKLVSTAYQPAQDARAPIALRRAARAAQDGLPQAPPRHTAEVRSLRPLADASAATPRTMRVRELNEALRGASARDILEESLTGAFAGEIAVLSSFGAEAAVSLHLVAQIDPATPVLFLDTDRHFAPTLSYRDELSEHLGLSDVRVLQPAKVDAAVHDPRGDLWRTNADLCCDIRKVRPLAQVTPGFSALITGRKRIHGAERLRLPVFEEVDGQVRVNPLANWGAEEIEAYFIAHDLPRHPLVGAGFTSIGCWPCTQPAASEDVRSGRWAGTAKRECGIHLPSRWAAQLDRAS